MRSLFLLVALFLFVGVSLYAQPNNAAPVVWERYRISEENVSLLFPKLPMKLVRGSHGCGELQKLSYYSYADGAAYELHITSKVRETPANCSMETLSGAEMVEGRLRELRLRNDFVIEAATGTVIPWQKLTSKNSTRWIASDPVEEHRWIELAVTHYPDKKPDFDRFVKSLEFSSSTGKEIGDGTSVILGDSGVDIAVTRDLTEMSPAERNASPTKTWVFGTSATYTDAARAAGWKGSVRLKVTYLANGSIGAVTPLTELPHGMTEQAVNAVRKVVFLPARLNGIPINVTTFNEYRWTIY